jgi:glycosyltransferase involved in cell wall biosynthesis
MKVAIISKSNRDSGGASRVAQDLANWLNEVGYVADHFIAVGNTNSVSFQKNLYGQGLSKKICQKTHSLTNRLGFREFFPVEYWFNLNHQLKDYDVVHFHDLYNAISPLTLALTARKKPTFFTVHDCSVFTGGCLYPAGCEKFISHCHNCPQLPQNSWKDKIRDRTKEVQSIKRWLSENNMIRYIFPSQWIANQASLSLSFKVPPVIIPNGIDLDFLSTFQKKQARNMLSIPTHRKVVIISANYLAAPHKGVRYAINALQACQDFDPLVIAVGHCNNEIRVALQGLDVIEIGFLDDAEQMAKIYAASDITMFCSLEDNLPLTVLEAMAASTVIVGFATGGVPEMIGSGQNGILVETANQEALNQALRKVLISPILEKMGQQARKDVEDNFSKRRFLEKHIQLYQSSLLY